MKFINTTGNTVYLQDIDQHIMYAEGELQDISVDDILKSKSFQQLTTLSQFEIVEIGDSRIEKNLKRMQDSMGKLKTIMSSNRKVQTSDSGADSTDIEVVVKGHFLEGGGYAKVNRNLVKALDIAGIKTHIDIIGNVDASQIDPAAKPLLQLRGRGSRNAIHIDSIIPSFSTASCGRNKVLYTTLESYTIPKQFLAAAAMYDEIWVTSDFCAEVLKKYNLKKKITVIPDSVDTDHYVSKGDKYEFSPSLNPFVFVSVFGWNYRKGFDVLLKSYLQEFSQDEPVTLLLVSKFQNSAKRSDVIRQEVDKYIKSHGGASSPHIARCSKSIPESSMPSLYRACNAFVLFSRGEGFGLPYVESSLCGLPVIGTNCSGQTMFLNHDNSSLLDIDYMRKIPPGLMNVHYWDNQEFPDFTSDGAVKNAGSLMRDVYENYSKAKKKNKKLQKHIKANYSINNISKMVKSRLGEIWR